MRVLCQFRDKFGVCVGNCSLGVSGVCKSFYIRSSDVRGSSEVSYALSKQSKAEAKSDSKRPELTGDATVGRYQDKKKVGNISLWVQEENLGTNKPVFLGNVQVDNAKVQVVAWLHGWHLVKD